MLHEKSLFAQRGIRFNHESCRFESDTPDSVSATPEEFSRPLSVILQVTRRCDFSCDFCSEIEPIADPSLEQLGRMRDHLRGVPRVFVSGGEPMLRPDFMEVLRLFGEGFIVGLPTNATIHRRIVPELKDLIAFANIGLDGPRAVTSRVRGDYDRVMEGIRRFRECGIPVSLSCVVLGSTVEAVPYLAQIADVLGARKLKLILPIPKGNALDLPKEEYISTDVATELFRDLERLKARFGWRPKLALTTWTAEVEGYSVLVFPNGDTSAWPVYDAPDKILRLGNLLEEPIDVLWTRHPFKRNHLRKYLGTAIHLT